MFCNAKTGLKTDSLSHRERVRVRVKVASYLFSINFTLIPTFSLREKGNEKKAQRNAGGSLIEILIAIFILAIIFTSYGSTFLMGRYTVRKTEVEKEAQNMARETVEELSNYVMYDTNTVLMPGLRLPDNRAGDTKWALQDGSTHYIDLPIGHPLLGNPLTGAVTRYYYVEDTGDGGKKVNVTVEWNEKGMPGQEN